MLLLSETDVRQLLTMEAALDAVAQAFRWLGLDEATNAPRTRVQTDHVMAHLLPAAAKRLGYAGYKAYATSKQGANFHVGLFDGKSGEFLALLQADYLGQMRTGAASGVATRWLARHDACRLGVIGAGKQARTQLLAIALVRRLDRAVVYCRDQARRRQFAEEMTRELQIPVVPAASPEEAVRNQDIVVTATTSREPVLFGKWITPGCHINAIGSNFLSKAELDVAAIRRCCLIIVDSKDQARLEAGDFVQALDQGVLHWADVGELSQVVVGQRPGRENADDVTLFKSLGLGIEDVAVAGKVYELARAAGVGRNVSW